MSASIAAGVLVSLPFISMLYNFQFFLTLVSYEIGVLHCNK